MNDSGKENLRELLARFMAAEAAGRAAADIEKGDELLRTNPAPQPGEDVVSGIKTEVSIALRRRHRITLQHRVFAVAAVAAAIVIASVLTLRFFNEQPVERSTVKYAAAIPEGVWEGSDITIDDADIAVLTAEVSTIENELRGVQLAENGGNGSAAVDDLEMELIGISGDFWKG